MGSASIVTGLARELPPTFPHDGRTLKEGSPDERAVALLDLVIIGRALEALAAQPGPIGACPDEALSSSEEVKVLRRLHRATSTLVEHAVVAEGAETTPTLDEWYRLLASCARRPRGNVIDTAESLVTGVRNTDLAPAWVAWGQEVWAVDDHAVAAEKVTDAGSVVLAEATALAHNTIPALARAVDTVLDHLDATDSAGSTVEPTWLLGLVTEAVVGCAQPAGFPPSWRPFVGRGVECTWSFGRGSGGPDVGLDSGEAGSFGVAWTMEGFVSVGFRPYRSNLFTLAHLAAFRDMETAHAFMMLAATAEFAGWDGHGAVRLPRADELLPPGVSISQELHPQGVGAAATVAVDGMPLAWFPRAPHPHLRTSGYAGMRGAVACAHLAGRPLGVFTDPPALLKRLSMDDGSARPASI